MTTQPNKNQLIEQAYFKILKHAKQLISTLEEAPLRQTLERPGQGAVIVGTIIHEFINALIYLRLECYEGNVYAIHYGYEQADRLTKYYPITSAFIRSIYSYTSKETSQINIEDCVRTDWVIINCAELFEYIGDRNKYHITKNIKYKLNKNKYKQFLEVV